MRHRLNLLMAAVMLSMPALASGADEASDADANTFRPGIILIGCQKSSDPDVSLIQTIAPDGTQIGEALPLGNRSIISGRLSPDGMQIGFSDGKSIWLVDSQVQLKKIADRAGFITAWSPDSKRLAFYRESASGQENAWTSFVIDVDTQQQTKLPITSDYVAEDWHSDKDLRTLIYMNANHRIHREKQKDWYPLRQLYLLPIDGEQTPLTKDPAFDNIWSRFSPTGDRIAHYLRRFVDGRPHEYAVVCAADGSHAQEVFGFTDFGKKEGLYWYRPNGFPVWSPDGKTIAWIVFERKNRDESIGRPELVLIPADGGRAQRISLADLGLKWVSAIDWR